MLNKSSEFKMYGVCFAVFYTYLSVTHVMQSETHCISDLKSLRELTKGVKLKYQSPGNR